MSWRKETNCAWGKKRDDIVAVGIGWTKRNTIIDSYICTVVNFTVIYIERVHSDEIPFIGIPKATFHRYLACNIEWDLVCVSQPEKVYLHIGQVHTNVRVCPSEIKKDVWWQLPGKLILRGDLSGLRVSALLRFHHPGARRRPDSQATSGSWRSKCRVWILKMCKPQSPHSA